MPRIAFQAGVSLAPLLECAYDHDALHPQKQTGRSASKTWVSSPCLSTALNGQPLLFPAMVLGQILSPPMVWRTARTSFSGSYDKSAVRVLPFIAILVSKYSYCLQQFGTDYFMRISSGRCRIDVVMHQTTCLPGRQTPAAQLFGFALVCSLWSWALTT